MNTIQVNIFEGQRRGAASYSAAMKVRIGEFSAGLQRVRGVCHSYRSNARRAPSYMRAHWRKRFDNLKALLRSAESGVPDAVRRVSEIGALALKEKTG